MTTGRPHPLTRAARQRAAYERSKAERLAGRPFALAHPEPDVHLRGDDKGRTYTPDCLALAIVLRLDRMLRGVPVDGAPSALDGTAKVASALETCVGGGAFVRAFRSVWGERLRVTGADPDLGAKGLTLCTHAIRRSVLDVALDPHPVGATNPPFGDDVGQDVTLAITRRLRAACTLSALLVPLDYLTQDGWAGHVAEASQVWPVVGRPWDHERGMVVLVWDRESRRKGPALHVPLSGWRS